MLKKNALHFLVYKETIVNINFVIYLFIFSKVQMQNSSLLFWPGQCYVVKKNSTNCLFLLIKPNSHEPVKTDTHASFCWEINDYYTKGHNHIFSSKTKIRPISFLYLILISVKFIYNQFFCLLVLFEAVIPALQLLENKFNTF